MILTLSVTVACLGWDWTWSPYAPVVLPSYYLKTYNKDWIIHTTGVGVSFVATSSPT